MAFTDITNFEYSGGTLTLARGDTGVITDITELGMIMLWLHTNADYVYIS